MIREITIRAVLNGYMVQVGCQTVVFTSISDLIGHLGAYLDNPGRVEEKFLATAVNAKHLNVVQTTQRLETGREMDRSDNQCATSPVGERLRTAAEILRGGPAQQHEAAGVYDPHHGELR